MKGWREWWICCLFGWFGLVMIGFLSLFFFFDLVLGFGESSVGLILRKLFGF